MAGKAKYLVERDGRYFARLVIPVRLRPLLNDKTELRTALGGDRRDAMRALPGAVSALQQTVLAAERQTEASTGGPVDPGRYPLSVKQIAFKNYEDRLVQDEAARNGDPRYASVGIDDGFVAQLRSGIAGRLTDADLDDLVGHRIRGFTARGNTIVSAGSTDWRALARSLCISELEALMRVSERDAGNFDGEIVATLLKDVGIPADELSPVPIKKLFEDYVANRQLIGSQRDAGRRQRPVIQNLIDFVKHQDARKLTSSSIRQWRDELMKTHKPKTVSDIYLSAVRSMLKWAVENEKLDKNVASEVRQEKPKSVYARERGYTDVEALAVLRACQHYSPKTTGENRTREHPSTTAAKRWVSILCAFTGSRISEVVQLRKTDVFKTGDIMVMRITPDAGTVKSGGYRDVPLHEQIIDLGFLDFVKDSDDGHLFSRSNSTDPATQLRSSWRVGGQIADWLHEEGLVPEGLQPSHGFRHRFKTVGLENGVSARVLDAICGHAGRTAGDRYGDVTVLARQRALSHFPRYDLT